MSAFSQSVNTAFDKLTLQVRERGQVVAREVQDTIVRRTPIRTGRAKASWTIVSSRYPNLFTYRDLSLLPPSAWLTRAQAEKIARMGQGFLKFSSVYTIANNLHYIRDLEYGRSRQAPSGMVELTVIQARMRLGVK